MEKTQTQRPLVLPAVCAQVPKLSMIAAAPAAHGHVGYRAVPTTLATGAALTRSRLLTQESVLAQGTNGFAAKQSATGMDPVGGVRGRPPRGCPV